MGKFAVILAGSAVDDLNLIQEKFRKQVVASIKSLADNPLPTAGGVKKLKGLKPSLYRLRSGDYRVLFRIEADTVTILRIIDRQDLQKIIPH